MADESFEPETVYHGSTYSVPPHEITQGLRGTRLTTFHAGTEQSAKDRLDFWAQPGDVPSYLHTYRITGGVGPDTWGDPITDEEYNEGLEPEDYDRLEPWEKSVPEDDTTTIHPYTNEGEDRGSTSYVIPTSMVGNNVKYLGTQFANWTTNQYGQKELQVLSGEGRSSSREDWK